MINKRNAWSTRSVVYVRLIPPGAADTVHYRLQIPESAGDRITLKAKLNYRKFEWFNTQFAYAGEPDPRLARRGVTTDFDNRPFVFTANTSTRVGQAQGDPDLPIIVARRDTEASCACCRRRAPAPEPKAVLKPDDWTRWNDYGIGFLLQGDLKHAEAAFMRVTEIAPKNPDGWVNIGRVRVQEGNVDGRARGAREGAGAGAGPGAGQLLLVARAEGRRQARGARRRPCEKVIAQYPRDRVVRNDLGRNLFLHAAVPRGDQAVRARR